MLVRGIGVRNSRRQIWLRPAGRFDLDVAPAVAVLNEVLVRGQRNSNVRGTQMGVEKLDIKIIKQVPTVFGEADLLRW